VPLEQRQDDFISLGDVETEGDFPRKLIIAPRTERHVEASFSIGETGQVMADVHRDLAHIELHLSLSC
jgi:hypothetical protein